MPRVCTAVIKAKCVFFEESKNIKHCFFGHISVIFHNFDVFIYNVENNNNKE